jgi:hypothetical protein
MFGGNGREWRDIPTLRVGYGVAEAIASCSVSFVDQNLRRAEGGSRWSSAGTERYWRLVHGPVLSRRTGCFVVINLGIISRPTGCEYGTANPIAVFLVQVSHHSFRPPFFEAF